LLVELEEFGDTLAFGHGFDGEASEADNLNLQLIIEEFNETVTFLFDPI